MEDSNPVVLIKDFSDCGGTSGSAVRKANGKHGALVPFAVLAWAKNPLNPFRSFSFLLSFIRKVFYCFLKVLMNASHLDQQKKEENLRGEQSEPRPSFSASLENEQERGANLVGPD
jgi:hypothetical protein